MSYFSAIADVVRLPLARDGRAGLRAAQIAAIHAVTAHFWASTRPALVVMPTGSGKTAVMLAASVLLRPARVLIIAPSRLLREQLAEKFRELDPLRGLGVVDAHSVLPQLKEVESRVSSDDGWNEFAAYDVVVATPHTISPGLADIPQPPSELFDLVVIDEAHHAPAPTFDAIAKAFPKARKLFFTATPFRRDERPIDADLAFTYDLVQARLDGVFGTVQFVPVEPAPSANADEEIAKAAAARLLLDRAQGFQHVLMVRTSTRGRADELAEIYKNTTSLRLRRVHSDVGAAFIRRTIDDLRNLAIDGVITVDMLGEGFDLPNLKVAALHSPHRSLAVTLQFIGRFARTSGPALGPATFFAVPTEIAGEAARLYVAGAEWNELVSDMTRERIEVERETRDVVGSFEAIEPDGLQEELESASEALLHSLRPYFHAKVYEVHKGVDFDQALQLPRGMKPRVLRHSAKHSALICIAREVTTCLWSSDNRLNDVKHELFILVHMPQEQLLFVCTSRREVAIYDMLVESVAGEDYRRLAPNEINRVLRGIASPDFFSVGMRNRASFGGSAESYRMISGRAADRAIRVSDGTLYDRGHAFGRGQEAGEAVTIGFSSASKVWANRREQIPALLKWFRLIALKIRDETAVLTRSGLDHLGVATRILQFPSGLVMADLSLDAFRRGTAQIRTSSSADVRLHWLVDLAVRIDAQSATRVELSLLGIDLHLRFAFDLSGRPAISALDDASTDAVIVDGTDRSEDRFVSWLNEHPFVLFSADLARIEGDSMYLAPRIDDLFRAADQIESIDWAASGIDPCLEKPKASVPGTSIFDFVATRHLGAGAAVLFLDDGAGEIADYIAVYSGAERVRVELHHCKAASGANVPNDQIDDLYEVVGQAVKCRRWMDARRLIEQVEHRAKNTRGSKFVKGDLPTLRALLEDPSRIVFQVVIVQPAIRSSPKETIAELLAAADAYQRGANVLPLRILGSAG